MNKILMAFLAAFVFNADAQYYEGALLGAIANQRDRDYQLQQRIDDRLFNESRERAALVREQREELRAQRADRAYARCAAYRAAVAAGYVPSYQDILNNGCTP